MLLQKEIDKESYNREILKTLSFFEFSRLELDMLCVLLDNGYTYLDGKAKDLIIKVIDKSRYHISNYIHILKKKGVLVAMPNKRGFYHINPLILNIIKSGEVSFKFKVIANDYHLQD